MERSKCCNAKIKDRSILNPSFRTCSQCNKSCELMEQSESTASDSTQQLTAEDAYNKTTEVLRAYSEGDLLGGNPMCWIEKYSAQQNAALIKEVEHLKENLELGINTRMKYEEAKVAGNKMEEALKLCEDAIMNTDSFLGEVITTALKEWEKLNK